MNFRHFLEMLKLDLWHFWKMSEIHCIKNARNQKSTFDLRWTLYFSVVSAYFSILKYAKPLFLEGLAHQITQAIVQLLLSKAHISWWREIENREELIKNENWNIYTISEMLFFNMKPHFFHLHQYLSTTTRYLSSYLLSEVVKRKKTTTINSLKPQAWSSSFNVLTANY